MDQQPYCVNPLIIGIVFNCQIPIANWQNTIEMLRYRERDRFENLFILLIKIYHIMYYIFYFR